MKKIETGNNMQKGKRKQTRLCWTIAIIVFLIMSRLTLSKLLSFSEESQNSHKLNSPEQPPIALSISENQTDDIPQTVTDKTTVNINIDDIHINEINSAVDFGRNYPSSEKAETTIWNEADIITYYGSSLVPLYIPNNLYASPNNTTQTAVLSETGEIWEDTIWLSFYHDYYEDGSPKLTETISAPKGFYLNASKIGLLTDFICTNSEQHAVITTLDQTPVIFGYRSIESGPFDPQTHIPSGYYDLYVAQFTFNAIEYELVFSQMELKEVVSVVASIIYNTDDVFIS